MITGSFYFKPFKATIVILLLHLLQLSSSVPTYVTLVVSKSSLDQFDNPLALFIPEENTSTFCHDIYRYNVISEVIYEKCLTILSIIASKDFFHMVPDQGQYVNEMMVFVNEQSVVRQFEHIIDPGAIMLFHDYEHRKFQVHGFGEWTDEAKSKFVDYKLRVQVSRSMQSVRARPDPFRHCTALAVEKHGAVKKVRTMTSAAYSPQWHMYIEHDRVPAACRCLR